METTLHCTPNLGTNVHYKRVNLSFVPNYPPSQIRLYGTHFPITIYQNQSLPSPLPVVRGPWSENLLYMQKRDQEEEEGAERLGGRYNREGGESKSGREY